MGAHTTNDATTADEPDEAPAVVPPHLLAEIQGLYAAWVPEDPDAAYAALPEGLDRPVDPVVSMFQGAQAGAHTSWGGTVSITHAEVEVSGRDAPDGASRGRWWALYVNGDPWYLAGARALGVPGADEGRVDMVGDGDRLIATTYRGESPIVQTVARVGSMTMGPAGGQFRYLIPGEGFPSILVPYACPTYPFELLDVEFLDHSDPSWALRPRRPIEVAWCVYSPRFTYAFGAPTPLP
jgi:hypothetical protein